MAAEKGSKNAGASYRPKSLVESINQKPSRNSSKTKLPPSLKASISLSTLFAMKAEEPDAIVVGAGILGCTLAATLAKQGRSVVLFERDMSEPDRIVGELLQPGGVKALTHLGLRDCLEGIDAIREFGYQVIYRDEKVMIPYLQRDELSSEGRSFHHGRFVMNLRKAAKNERGYMTFWRRFLTGLEYGL